MTARIPAIPIQPTLKIMMNEIPANIRGKHTAIDTLMNLCSMAPKSVANKLVIFPISADFKVNEVSLDILA